MLLFLQSNLHLKKGLKSNGSLVEHVGYRHSWFRSICLLLGSCELPWSFLYPKFLGDTCTLCRLAEDYLQQRRGSQEGRKLDQAEHGCEWFSLVFSTCLLSLIVGYRHNKEKTPCCYRSTLLYCWMASQNYHSNPSLISHNMMEDKPGVKKGMSLHIGPVTDNIKAGHKMLE